MPQDISQVSDAERAELERVLEALIKWPRLVVLLRFMGDKFFSGKADELDEYNIATEVFGRSKNVFDASKDAIARVETHRLRKRLTEFYENEGKNHLVQVTLPAGSYVPAFVHKPQEVSSPVAPNRSSAAPWQLVDTGWHRTALNWKYFAWITGLLLAGVGVYLYTHSGEVSQRGNANPAPSLVAEPVQNSELTLPIRLLAGYNGPPRTDRAGRVWNPDQYFTAGAPWQPSARFIARTSDRFIFEHSRTGDFSYSIPLKPGIYELHLFFSTTIRTSDALADFNVFLNGRDLLRSFDISVDAFGPDVADERVFRDVSPESDGFLRLAFRVANGAPTLNAIEILPGIPHAQLPVRIAAQEVPLTDHQGRFWQPDTYFLEGRMASVTHPLLQSPDPDLFASERYGHFSYAIPVDTRGRYQLVLHFAEHYFGSGAPGNGGVGSRTFNVICNGETLLANFDVFKEAGSLHEITKTFHHLKPSPQGKLNVTFEPIVNNATISGIEVLDESN
jgi:hypothetical protein